MRSKLDADALLTQRQVDAFDRQVYYRCTRATPAHALCGAVMRVGGPPGGGAPRANARGAAACPARQWRLPRVARIRTLASQRSGRVAVDDELDTRCRCIL